MAVHDCGQRFFLIGCGLLQLRFQPRGSHGEATLRSVDEMDVLAPAQGKHQTYHKGMVGVMDAEGDIALAAQAGEEVLDLARFCADSRGSSVRCRQSA